MDDAVSSNKMCSFNNSGNIYNEEDWPHRSVSNDQFLMSHFVFLFFLQSRHEELAKLRPNFRFFFFSQSVKNSKEYLFQVNFYATLLKFVLMIFTPPVYPSTNLLRAESWIGKHTSIMTCVQ